METREEILKRINWDYTYSVEEIDKIIRGNNFQDKKPFLIKLLKSVRWYNLREAFSEQEIKEMLSSDIINNLPVASLREKFKYASRVLYE